MSRRARFQWPILVLAISISISTWAGRFAVASTDGTCPNFQNEIVICGRGICGRATESTCINHVAKPAPDCIPGTPQPEVQNGLDDDCDGLTDDVPIPIGELPPCTPNDTHWYCCPQGPAHFTVDQTQDEPAVPAGTDIDDKAAGHCFPKGSGMGGSCNLRSVVRRTMQLRARAGVRPACSVVAELPNGDYRLVQYSRPGSSLFLGGGDLTLQGLDAANKVVIHGAAGDATKQARIFEVRNFLAPVSLTVNQITMRDGYAHDTSLGGGGIFAMSGQVVAAQDSHLVSVAFNQAIVDNNAAAQPGGGVYVENAALSIRDSIFRNNMVENNLVGGGMTSLGGGFHAENSQVVVERSAFVGNTASKGGGIAVRSLFVASPPLASLDIKNSTMAENFCAAYGCGLSVENADLKLMFNTISDNRIQVKPGMASGDLNWARLGPGIRAKWDPNLPALIEIWGNIIAGNKRDVIYTTHPGDGESPDCHLEGVRETTEILTVDNLVGATGSDCALLGDPATDPLIGPAVPVGSSPDAAHNPALTALRDSPTNVCAPNASPGFVCQTVCSAEVAAATCMMNPMTASPALAKGLAGLCPTDDQRTYTRLTNTNCTLGAIDAAAIAPRSQQISLTVLPRGGWIPTASSVAAGGDTTSAFDGNATTRFSTGVPQTAGQWFSMDMVTRQLISQISLDPGPSTNDYPRQYQVFVSDDAVTWSGPVASGTGAPGVLTIPFPTQVARFVGVVQTGSASNGWSISEANVFGPGSVPLAPLAPTGWVASASATNGSDVASRALDGNLSTRWSTGTPQASGQSFQVDMLQPRTIGEVLMNSGSSTNDYPRAFSIYATNDTSNWGAPIATGTSASSPASVTFPLLTTRYLKIVQTGTASSWWSIAELTVYGLGTFQPTAMPLSRVGWLAMASASCSSDTAPKALDDQLSTRFSTCQNQASGQSFQVDMLTAQTFSQVTLDAGSNNGDYPRAYSVYATNNPSNWGAPIATGVGSAQLVKITFPNQNARFIKIVQTGSASSNWWSIAELNVYGVPPAILPRESWTASASLATSAAGAGIDSTLSTRWTTGVPQTSGQYYQIDLGAARTFNLVRLDADGASSDYPRSYQVFASNNSTSFGAPIAVGAGSSSLLSIGFPVQTARYLRIVQAGSDSHWWSIAEANIWGPPQ